jgi:hypothetical protein
MSLASQRLLLLLAFPDYFVLGLGNSLKYQRETDGTNNSQVDSLRYADVNYNM